MGDFVGDWDCSPMRKPVIAAVAGFGRRRLRTAMQVTSSSPPTMRSSASPKSLASSRHRRHPRLTRAVGGHGHGPS
jgi:hypothetical protein